MYKRYGLIVGTGLLTGLLLYGLIFWFIQAPVNRMVNDVASYFSNIKRIRRMQEGLFQESFNFMGQSGVLVEGLRSSNPNLQLADQGTNPLNNQVDQEKVLSKEMPIFYFSPNVAKMTPYSYVNKERLIEVEALNGFAWYMVDGEKLLYQNYQPFSGWHDTPFDGWYYYEKGKLELSGTISTEEATRLSQERKDILNLTPRISKRNFYITSNSLFARMIETKSVDYSIVYKNPNQLILSAPPGTKDSHLIANTSNFVETPMHVVKEMLGTSGTWLKVKLGQDDLGWILKDETFQDYKLTNYSEDEMLLVLSHVIKEELSAIDARVGASFINNETMAQIDIDNQIFFPASTQKIYVLTELYSQYKSGKLSPTDTVTLEAGDAVGGAGVVGGYPVGTEFTLDELVNAVVTISDNTAANLLIDAVGGGKKITPHMHQLGMYDTYVDGKYYNTNNREFYTTPHDAARLFALLANHKLNGEPWDSELIDKFYMNSHNYLRNYMPGGTVSYNKSGTGYTEQNDVATFETPYGSYTLAVYTADPTYYKAISDQMGLMSLRVHNVFNEMRAELWKPYNPDAEIEYSETNEEIISE